ncbi:hypothetical protein ASZ90_016022 [hydrocarbon metagenome]|uniref:Uncharacterized protein n=1 Tax=hydrocarbon metagenome TaxID=938273 RepID=A0A0W8F0I6_9ZZZZ
MGVVDTRIFIGKKSAIVYSVIFILRIFLQPSITDLINVQYLKKF